MFTTYWARKMIHIPRTIFISLKILGIFNEKSWEECAVRFMIILICSAFFPSYSTI